MCVSREQCTLSGNPRAVVTFFVLSGLFLPVVAMLQCSFFQRFQKKRCVLLEEVPHIPQIKSWDCGLACLTMSLRYLRPELTEEDITAACETHGLGESVWTIDLAYLCVILGIPHHFYTQTLGVDKNYANESFYVHNMKSNFTDEEVRVNNLFENACRSRVNVEKNSVKVDKILKHLEKGQPIIVLINDKELRPGVNTEGVVSTTPDGELGCWLRRWLCCTCHCKDYSSIHGGDPTDRVGTEFWGHYVVIVGYDINQKVFIFNDPAINGKHLTCGFETFDKARKSFGTDEDILFLSLPT